MSCHNIGTGINTITQVVIKMYEEKQMTKGAFVAIINACKNGVHWCDGNEGEAIIALMEAGYCGLCFEKKNVLEDIFDKGEVAYLEIEEAFSNMKESPTHYCFCKKCKKRILDECNKIKNRKPLWENS